MSPSSSDRSNVTIQVKTKQNRRIMSDRPEAILTDNATGYFKAKVLNIAGDGVLRHRRPVMNINVTRGNFPSNDDD